MGEVVRGTLATRSFPLTAGAFELLGVWCIVSFAVAYRILARRA
jgi:hypothetical protein